MHRLGFADPVNCEPDNYYLALNSSNKIAAAYIAFHTILNYSD